MADTWEDVPAGGGWEDAPSAGGGWEDVPPPAAPGPSAGTSALMGAGNAASFGFNDEAGGFLGAAGDALGITGQPEIVRAQTREGVPIQNDAADAQDAQTFGDRYRGYRDGIREVDQAARDAHPLAYHGAGIAAAAVNPLGAASKGAAAGERILTAGANGVLAGAGNSTADVTQGDFSGAAKDSALGGGVGLATGAALEGLGSGGRWLFGKADARQAARAAANAEPRQIEMDLGDAAPKGSWTDALMEKGGKAVDLASDVWSLVAGNPLPMAKRAAPAALRATDAVLVALGDAAKAGGNAPQLIARAVAIGIPEETAAAIVHGNQPRH